MWAFGTVPEEELEAVRPAHGAPAEWISCGGELVNGVCEVEPQLGVERTVEDEVIGGFGDLLWAALAVPEVASEAFNPA